MPDVLLMTAGAAVALPTTYLFLRRTLFRRQEMSEASHVIQSDPACKGLTAEQVREGVNVYFRSTTPLFGCLASVGWLMFVVALLR